MKRNRLLYNGLCLVLALVVLSLTLACAGGGAPPAATKVRWRLNILGAPRPYTAGVDKFVALVSERTGGNFVIEVVYGEALAKSTEALDAIKAGAFEAGYVSPEYHPGKTPLSVVVSLPFMKDFGDPFVIGYAMMKWYEDFPAAKKELAAWNVRAIYPIGQTAMNAIGNKALRKPEDWKGVRIRGLGAMNDAFKKLGAVPVSIPAPEVFDALQKGVIDVGTMTVSSLMAYGMHQVSKYLMVYPLGNAMNIVVASETAYNALPKDYQKVLDGAWVDALLWHAGTYSKDNQAAIDKARQAKVEVIDISDAEYAGLVEVAGKPVWDAWVAAQEKAGLPGKAALAALLEKVEVGKKELAKRTK